MVAAQVRCAVARTSRIVAGCRPRRQHVETSQLVAKRCAQGGDVDDTLEEHRAELGLVRRPVQQQHVVAVDQHPGPAIGPVDSDGGDAVQCVLHRHLDHARLVPREAVPVDRDRNGCLHGCRRYERLERRPVGVARSVGYEGPVGLLEVRQANTPVHGDGPGRPGCALHGVDAPRMAPLRRRVHRPQHVGTCVGRRANGEVRERHERLRLDTLALEKVEYPGTVPRDG
ncbi:MAG: hypothetical protein DYH08_05005 [Actinobacteria bacterium ATB1]|nr:hypothetical protein [Actinobacteria bacterium ATB1]